MKERHKQKLVILSIVLLLVLNIPILLLFNSADQLFGFPVIYVFFFSVWLFSVVASFLVFKKFDE